MLKRSVHSVALSTLVTMSMLTSATVQAQDDINDAKEFQRPTTDSLHESSTLPKISSDAVERKTNTTPTRKRKISQPAIQGLNTDLASNTDLACNNANFTSSIAGGFLSNSPFIRTDKTPSNYSAFKEHSFYFDPDSGYSIVDYKPRYRYEATFTNIKEWRGKICAKSVQNLSNDHTVSYQHNNPGSTCPSGGQVSCKTYVGPTISFEIKEKLGGGTQDSWVPLSKNNKTAVYQIPANNIRWYHWAWRTGQPTDFRLVVYNATGLDEFDFMMDK